MASSEVPSNKRKHEVSNSHTSRKARKLEASSSDDKESADDLTPGVRANKHSKKERKQNRSTRIHSIRKLLARGTLPSTIRQEKERELSALLLEQDQSRAKKLSKKTLEKYHYVRFVERQKAEKKLKQLRRNQNQSPDDETLKIKIHDMEVNRAYAVYAPLSKKYIAIFASANDNRGRERQKPSMWYTVEKAMEDGEEALVAIREGETVASQQTIPKDRELMPGKQKQANVRPKMRQPDAGSTAFTGSRATSSNAEQQQQSTDEDLSDGGFFER